MTPRSSTSFSKPKKIIIRKSLTNTVSEQQNTFPLWPLFTSLTQEVTNLECEVTPLRAKMLRLQNQIMSQNRHADITDEELIEDAVSPDPIFARQKYTTAMVQLQEERTALANSLSRARETFSDHSKIYIQKEVQESSQICSSLQQKIGVTRKQIEKTCLDIESYKVSKLYEDIQLQKEQIAALSQKLSEAQAYFSQLKTEHFMLTDPNSAAFVEEDESQEEIKLQRRLNFLRRKNLELYDEFVALRQKQMKEIEKANAAISQQSSVASMSSQFQLPSFLSNQVISGMEVIDEIQ